MATLIKIVSAIDAILDDPVYTDAIIVDNINSALSIIAAGIEMPNGQVSPPLPDLFAYTTVNTDLLLPYVSLPDNYQRGIVGIFDNSAYIISPPCGGDYYSFNLFLKQINNLNLVEVGSIYRVCIKGSKLYYQGIPSVATALGLHYYRKPAVMALDGDIPEGVPEHLQLNLLKHFVCKEIMGEKIEDGQDNMGIGTKYHAGKFYEYMTMLVNFIGIDSSPQYYGSDGFEDRGACDV